MTASAQQPPCSVDKERRIVSSSAVMFFGIGTAGAVLSLVLGSFENTLSWSLTAQALMILIVWPGLYGAHDHAISPLVMIFISAPVYILGAVLGGYPGSLVFMDLLLIYIMFLYVPFMLRLERIYGRETGSWFIPVSGILAAGPIFLYYVLVEFLKRPVSWVSGVSPFAALNDPGLLSTGCAAWAAVLTVVVAAGMLKARDGEDKDEG